VTFNHGVVGSSPTALTIFRAFPATAKIRCVCTLSTNRLSAGGPNAGDGCPGGGLNSQSERHHTACERHLNDSPCRRVSPGMRGWSLPNRRVT
jgi:hypothetical protein